MINIRKTGDLKRILILLAVFFLLCPPALGQVKKVALFPLAFNGDASKDYLKQGVRSMLLSRLDNQDLEVINDEIMNSVFEDQNADEVRSPKKAEAVARRMNADYAIFGSINALGDDCSIDLGILDLQQKKPKPEWLSASAAQDDLIAAVEDLARKSQAAISGKQAAAALKKQPPAEVEPDKKRTAGGIFLEQQKSSLMIEPDGSLPLDMAVMAFDTGDLNGDGSMELVVLARKQVRIYTRSQDGFALQDTLKPSSGRSFLQVSTGDADGNGKDEVCIVSGHGIRAESSVWEWDGEFKRLYERNGHLRITKLGNNGNPVMLFQESLSQEDSFFYGDIWVMKIDRQGNPVKEKALALPDGAQFYSIIFRDIIGDNQMETLFLGRINARQRGLLHLGNAEGQTIWQSD
ncbi:MAG: VCBS repeat-containing protein, partial [Desulfobacteraceae bacterium]|nr:VCBS repeat-containing protein [Desulfobacteraceae bacterium]